MSRSSVLEYMAIHMRNAVMCETFIRVAATQYPDLLPKVRQDVARAMSVWLGLHDYSAEVKWSGDEDCFIGHLRNTGRDSVSFHGKTPIGLERAFEKAVRDYMDAQARAPETAEEPVATPQASPAPCDSGGG